MRLKLTNLGPLTECDESKAERMTPPQRLALLKAARDMVAALKNVKDNALGDSPDMWLAVDNTEQAGRVALAPFVNRLAGDH
jgi:hypothetical protein